LGYGKRIPPPLLIGDPERAQQVIECGSTTGKTQFTTLAGAAMKALAAPEFHKGANHADAK
ncbi:MAG: hypothetical protein ACRCTD_17455, partial [Beijerinckiaceae bacterium]